jgi:hypothetical protein
MIVTCHKISWLSQTVSCYDVALWTVRDGNFAFQRATHGNTRLGRYDLTDFEWRVIEPLLPNKPRGVPRVDDRRVLNGTHPDETLSGLRRADRRDLGPVLADVGAICRPIDHEPPPLLERVSAPISSFGLVFP